MIAISSFLVFACLALAMALIVDLASSRGRLFQRLAGLAPGASLTGQVRASRRSRNLSKEDAIQVDLELTELVEMLVAVLLAGESLFSALRRIANNSRGKVSAEFSKLLSRIELGGEMTTELSALCERLPTSSVREFSNKLSLAIARGTPLANSLSALALSLRAKRAASLLRRAGTNETKMLIPVVLLICPVTVIFALYPSSQFLAAGFI
ncbi:MAG: hypothetical protein RL612_81 [Actinomycetota bacterium]